MQAGRIFYLFILVCYKIRRLHGADEFIVYVFILQREWWKVREREDEGNNGANRV